MDGHVGRAGVKLREESYEVAIGTSRYLREMGDGK